MIRALAASLVLFTSCGPNVPDFAFPRYKSLGAAFNFLCGLKDDGNVECLDPIDGEGKLFYTLKGSELVALPRQGSAQSCAVTDRTEIRCWSVRDYAGSRDLDGLDPPRGSFSMVSSDSLTGAICGVRATSGAILCAAKDEVSAIADNAPSGQYKTVAVGDLEACGLSTAGEIRCWGKDVSLASWPGIYDDLRCINGVCAGSIGGTTLSSPTFGNIDFRPFIDFAYFRKFLCVLAVDGAVECKYSTGATVMEIPSTPLVTITIEESPTHDPTWICGDTAAKVPVCYALPSGKRLTLSRAEHE
ncbi:MAG: hypothetical protein IT381_24590 [Deltaproteobacteria bacterium]|nr:hypothetical protein [Deltaproteobacteria bacterium]